MKVLVMEDDKEINRLICEVVRSCGYEAAAAFDGKQGMELFLATKEVALVLLDLMLPLCNGETVLRNIREISDVPVIVISAKTMIRSKVALLRQGADDYMTKPFDIDELVVRMEAVLRRYQGAGNMGSSGLQRVLSYGTIVIEPETATVTVNGATVTLTSKEYAILRLLLANPTKLFSKQNLFESVWQEEYLADDAALKVHISNLRSKLKQADDFDYIETVWGMGYRLRKQE